jgi:uncharacterized membrane protein
MEGPRPEGGMESLGRYLVLGPGFQLSSDVLRTAVTATLQALAEFPADARIRTAPSFVLHEGTDQEQQHLPAGDGTGADRVPGQR